MQQPHTNERPKSKQSKNQGEHPRSLRQILKRVWDAICERILSNSRDFLGQRQPLVWLLALVVGVIVAYAAIAFRWLIGVIQYPWLGTTSENVATAAANVPWWIILIIPAVGGLIVGWMQEKFVAGGRPHSVADVIEAGAVHDSRIDRKSGFLSALTATISIGTGASVGREGPIVHFGATIASAIEDHFHLSASNRRTLLASGVAAAVSASFNAPIAGVLFAHEVILGHYSFRALVPIVISSVAGGIIARIHFGDFPAFMIPHYQITSYWEFPAFALLGVTCAVVAMAFQFVLIASNRLALLVDIPWSLRAAIGGALVGTIAIFFPEILGVGYETTNAALSQKLGLGMLFALIFAKAAATAISLASRFSGGVFSPSLYLGAMTGAAFGTIATSVFPEIGSSQGLYAILGMGAVAGAVLGAPLSTILIVFELTGGYEMTIALMLTVSIAVGITQAIIGHSYFHWQLARRGLILQDGPHKSIVQRLCVKDFMIKVEPDKDAPDVKAPRITDTSQPVLLPNDTLEHALRQFDRTGKTRLPVVDGRDRTQVIAWAERLQALSLFNSALIDSHIEAHK